MKKNMKKLRKVENLLMSLFSMMTSIVKIENMKNMSTKPAEHRAKHGASRASWADVGVSRYRRIVEMSVAGVLILIAMPAGVFAQGTVILTFDDGWTYNAIDNASDPFGGADLAQPILKANNQSAVAFIIEEPIVGGWGAYMNISQVQSLYNDGWDISSHSLTHGSHVQECTTAPDSSGCTLYLVNANDTLFKSEMGDSKNWLDNNGWTKGSMFFAYPYGAYNPSCASSTGCDGTESGNLIYKMKASGYYIGARTVDGYSGTHPNFNVGAVGTLIMPTLSTDVTSVTVADIKSEIDKTISENGLLILTFHKLVYGKPINAEEYNVNDFKNISDYLKLKNSTGDVRVVTLSKYFGVPNPIPTYIPNNATLQSITTGRTWLNITWSDGPGNITNEYEVLANGVQNYYITNRSFNITGLVPGQSVTAVIDAVNTSWGGHTKNIVPLTATATIPVFTPPTPNITSTYGDSWVLASWTPGTGLNDTDFYDVNVLVRSSSVWYNETKNTSINTTGISPGQSVTVKVYALNGTVGLATMNNTPAIVETTVPGTNIPVIISNTTDSANFTMNWKYIAGQNTDLVEININNGGVESNRTENLSTNSTGTLVLENLSPHVTVNFGIRGKNQTTGLYSDYVYANMTLANNPVVLSNLSADYKVTQGQVLTLYPKATDLDKDPITFSTTKINQTSIDSTTGVFYFDATNASLNMYNINITAEDGYGSTSTQKVSILVNGVPVPAPLSGGSRGGSSGGSGGSGGGGGLGSSENYSNIARFETEDGYIQLGKDATITFSTIPYGIYQVFLRGESQEVTVRVDNLRHNQSGTVAAPGKALLYTNVMINSERINGFSFSFKLNKSDVSNPENIRVYRWNNGTWELLDTNMTSASDSYVYFQTKAVPAKLSKFAITELDVSGTPTVKTTPREVGDNGINVANASKFSEPKNSSKPQENRAPGFEIVAAIGAILAIYISIRRR